MSDEEASWPIEQGRMALVSTRVTQFPYYDQVLGQPDWRGRKILDFGGNNGGFLAGAGTRIDHGDYWCMDITQEALRDGRRRYPKAHFVHYNRYHSEYNPEGARYEPVPDCGLHFDFILPFSVFTHTHRSELVELVAQLRKMLAPGGRLAFTFTDPSYDTGSPSFPSGRYMLKLLKVLKRTYSSLDVETTYQKACQAKWAVLIDDELWVEPGGNLCQQVRIGRSFESYCAYYSADYMASLFPDAEILSPTGEEWQHCCILGR
jgi:SAM-dependent methyltransferase